jgi:hypothetical protein
MKAILVGSNEDNIRLELIAVSNMFVISAYDSNGEEINREWFNNLSLAQETILARLGSDNPLLPAKKGVSVVTTN